MLIEINGLFILMLKNSNKTMSTAAKREEIGRYDCQYALNWPHRTKKGVHQDFAYGWKGRALQAIMRWPSLSWEMVFVPGWHLEAPPWAQIPRKKPFDIHGGGMDLKFFHIMNVKLPKLKLATRHAPVKNTGSTPTAYLGRQKNAPSSTGNNILQLKCFLERINILTNHTHHLQSAFFDARHIIRAYIAT